MRVTSSQEERKTTLVEGRGCVFGRQVVFGYHRETEAQVRFRVSIKSGELQYLCTVLDLYSRRVVGWSLSISLGTEVVLAAVAMAVIRRRPPKGLMFHSDRGGQYTSGEFRKIATGYGFIQSMSRRGDCWDNACAETFFKTLRAELIRGTEVGRRPGKRYSSTWRSSTIASGFTRTWATSHRRNTRSSGRERRPDGGVGPK